VRMLHHFLTPQMESWGFIKPLVQTYTIDMKLSLCLNFQPRCSLGGYTVGATTGFCVMIMEALAP
jgi:hypothetical protein